MNWINIKAERGWLNPGGYSDDRRRQSLNDKANLIYIDNLPAWKKEAEGVEGLPWDSFQDRGEGLAGKWSERFRQRAEHMAAQELQIDSDEAAVADTASMPGSFVHPEIVNASWISIRE